MKYKWNIADQLKAIAHMYDNMKGFAITKEQADSFELESHKALNDFFVNNATKHEKLIYPSYETAMEEDQHDFMLDWQRSSSGPYKSHQKELVDKIGYSLLNTKNKKIRDKFKDADYDWDGNIHVKTFADDVSSYTGGEIIDELRKVFSNDEVMEILKDAGIKGIKNIGGKGTLARSEFRDSYDDVKIDDKDRYYFDKIFDDELKRRKKQKIEEDKDILKIVQEEAQNHDVVDISWPENSFSPYYLMPQYDIFKKFNQAKRVRNTGKAEGDFRDSAQANEYLDAITRSMSVAYKILAYVGKELNYDDNFKITNEKVPGLYTHFYNTRTNLTNDYLARGEKDFDDFTYMRRMLAAAMTYTPSQEMLSGLRKGSRAKAYEGLEDNSAVIKSIFNGAKIRFDNKDFEQTLKKIFVGQDITPDKARKIGEAIAHALSEELKRSGSSSILTTESADDIRKREKKLNKERVNQIKEDIANRAEPRVLSTAGNVINKVAMYGTATAVFYGIARSITNAIETMKNFETQLVETTKVLNPAYEGTSRISEAAQDFGQKYGTSIVNVAGAMSVFAQQGKSVVETINLTEASLLAANTTTLKAADATEALTVAIRQFNISDKDAKSVIDSWLEVESRTAVTAKTLASAMKQTGTAARNSGISFHELNGMISAVGSATRESGNAIGTALKYIFSHMNTEDVIEKFNKLGIAVYDADGRMRDLMDRLSDLNASWQQMSSEQKTATAIAIAGTRRYNSLMILMDRWGDVIDATRMSEDSYGRSMSMNERVMGTYAKQVEKTKAAMESFFSGIYDSGAKGLLSYFENLKQMIAGVGAAMPESLSALLGNVGVLGAATFGMSRVFAYSGIGDFLKGIDRRRNEERLFNRQYSNAMSPVYGSRSKTYGSLLNVIIPNRLTKEKIAQAEANLSQFRLERVEDPLHPGAKKLDFVSGTKGEKFANELREKGVAEERIIALGQQKYAEYQKEIDVLKNANSGLKGFGARLNSLGMNIQRHAAIIGTIGIGLMSISNSDLFKDKYSKTGKNYAGIGLDFAGAMAFGAASGAMFGGPYGAAIGAGIAGIGKGFEYIPKLIEYWFGSLYEEIKKIRKESDRIKNIDTSFRTYSNIRRKLESGELLSPEEEAKYTESQNVIMLSDPNAMTYDKEARRFRIKEDFNNRNNGKASESTRRELLVREAYAMAFGGGGKYGGGRQTVFDREIEEKTREVERARDRYNRASGVKKDKAYDEFRKLYEELQKLILERDESLRSIFRIYESGVKDIVNYSRSGGKGFDPTTKEKGYEEIREKISTLYTQLKSSYGEEEANRKITSAIVGAYTQGRTYSWNKEIKERGIKEGKFAILSKNGTDEKTGESNFGLYEIDYKTGEQRKLKEDFKMKSGSNESNILKEATKGTGLDASQIFYVNSSMLDYFNLPLKTVDKLIGTFENISKRMQDNFNRNLKYAELEYKLLDKATLTKVTSYERVSTFIRSLSNRKNVAGDISELQKGFEEVNNIKDASKRYIKRLEFGAQVATGNQSGTLAGQTVFSMNQLMVHFEKLDKLDSLVSMVNRAPKNTSEAGKMNLDSNGESKINLAEKEINEIFSSHNMNVTVAEIAKQHGNDYAAGLEAARKMASGIIIDDIKKGGAVVIDSIKSMTENYLSFTNKISEVSENIEKSILTTRALLMSENPYMTKDKADEIARNNGRKDYEEVIKKSEDVFKNVAPMVEALKGFVKNLENQAASERKEIERLRQEPKTNANQDEINRRESKLSVLYGQIYNVKKQLDGMILARDTSRRVVDEAGITAGIKGDIESFKRYQEREKIRRSSEGITTSRNVFGGRQQERIEQLRGEDNYLKRLALDRLKENGLNYSSIEDVWKRAIELSNKKEKTDAERKELAKTNAVLSEYLPRITDIQNDISKNINSRKEEYGKQFKQLRTDLVKTEFFGLTGNKNTASAQASFGKNMYEEAIKRGTEYWYENRDTMSQSDKTVFLEMFKKMNNQQELIDKESSLGYRKSYLLASSQERAVADMITARRQQGESFEDIFSDNALKEYAKNHPLIQQTIDFGLQREINTRILDVQVEQLSAEKEFFSWLKNNDKNKDRVEGYKFILDKLPDVIRSAVSVRDNFRNVKGFAEGYSSVTGSGGKFESGGIFEVHKGEGLGVINANAMARNPELSKKILSTISAMNKGEIVGFAGGTKLNDTSSFYSSLERLNDVVSRGVEQSSYATNVRLNAIEKALKDIFGINGVMETRLLPPDSGVNYVTQGNIFVGPNSTPQTRLHELLHGRAYDTYNIGLGRSFGVREMMSELGSFAITGKATESGYTNRDMVRILNSNSGLNSKNISQRLANMFDYMRKNPKEIFKYIKDIEKSVGDNINKGGDFVYRSGSKSLRMDVAKGIEELGSVSIELAKKMGATSRQVSILEKSINKAASKYSNGAKTIDDSVSRMYNTKDNVFAQTMLRNDAIEFGDTYSGNGIILGRKNSFIDRYKKLRESRIRNRIGNITIRDGVAHSVYNPLEMIKQSSVADFFRAGGIDYIKGNMYDKLLAGPVGGVKGFYNKRINPVLNSTSNFISNVYRNTIGGFTPSIDYVKGLFNPDTYMNKRAMVLSGGKNSGVPGFGPELTRGQRFKAEAYRQFANFLTSPIDYITSPIRKVGDIKVPFTSSMRLNQISKESGIPITPEIINSKTTEPLTIKELMSSFNNKNNKGFISSFGKGVKGVARGIVGNPIGMLMAANAVKDISENGFNAGNVSQLAFTGAPYVPALFNKIDSEKLAARIGKSKIWGSKSISKLVNNGFIKGAGKALLKGLPIIMTTASVLPQLYKAYKQGWDEDVGESILDTTSSTLTNLAFGGVPAIAELVNSLAGGNKYTQNAADAANALGSIMMLGSDKRRKEVQGVWSIARRNGDGNLGFYEKLGFILSQTSRNDVLNANRRNKEFSIRSEQRNGLKQELLNRINTKNISIEDAVSNALSSDLRPITKNDNEAQNKQAGAAMALLAERDTFFDVNEERRKILRKRRMVESGYNIVNNKRVSLNPHEQIKMLKDLDRKYKNVDSDGARRTFARTFADDIEQFNKDFENAKRKHGISDEEIKNQISSGNYSGTDRNKTARAFFDLLLKKSQSTSLSDIDSIYNNDDDERYRSVFYRNEDVNKKDIQKKVDNKEKDNKKSLVELWGTITDEYGNKFSSKSGMITQKMKERMLASRDLEGNAIYELINKDGKEIITRAKNKENVMASLGLDQSLKAQGQRFKEASDQREIERETEQFIRDHQDYIDEEYYRNDLADSIEEEERRLQADNISGSNDKSQGDVNNDNISDDIVEGIKENNNELVKSIPDEFKPLFQAIVNPLDILVRLIQESKISPNEIGPTINNLRSLNVGDKVNGGNT